jgi:hypothetical protein
MWGSQVFLISRGKMFAPLGRWPIFCARFFLRYSGLMFILAVTVGVPAPIHAQTSPDSAVRLTTTPVRTEVPPVIDGNLNDVVWETATRLSGFVQQRPLEGAPASEKTEVYIAYDSETLYFGIYAYYSDPGLIRANRADRDKTSNDDTVAIYLDPFLDAQRGYAFSVNGFGIQADQLLSSMGGGDANWNALYESAGVLVEDGWIAEMAIPIKSIRYPRRSENELHRWGFQIQREIKGKDEIVNWSPVSSNILGTLTQTGVIEGMQNLSTHRNLELLPTVTAVRVGRLNSAGNFVNDHVEEAGLNVKYGLTSNLTFDFTYNPDFSQIESDRPQIEINQRFPVFFPELRPFFIEGQEIFNIPFGPPIRMVQTRTIVDPQFGAKLTGKLGKTSIGFMVANDEAPGRIDDPSSRAYQKTAKIVMGRIKHDIYTDSFVGAFVADREFLDQYSRVVDIDGVFRLGANYQTQAKYIISRHRDANNVERSGHAVDIMHRRAGRNFTYVVAWNDITPGFRNDLGFITRTFRRYIGNVGYRWWPEHWLTNWGIDAWFDHAQDYDTGELQEQVRRLTVNSLFAKNIAVTGIFEVNRERFLGVDFNKHRFSINTLISTNRKIQVGLNVSTGDQIRFSSNPFLGSATGANLTVTLRPVPRLQSEISVSTNRFRDLRTNARVFDIKIFYAKTTYQFTERLLVRNIIEHNTLTKTFGLNLLGTYRVNAGTVFFLGYDDRYQHTNSMDIQSYRPDQYQRTNHAVFTKLQYLYRR